MLKNILNLDGAQKLSKNEQKEIKGGIRQTPVCGGAEGAFITSLNSCLCKNGGIYSNGVCSNGANNTNYNRLFENATGCCYLTNG